MAPDSAAFADQMSARADDRDHATNASNVHRGAEPCFNRAGFLAEHVDRRDHSQGVVRPVTIASDPVLTLATTR
jgi:hypothetical protein